MKRKHFDIIGAAGEISRALEAHGCTFEVEADNRGGDRASRYLCVRKPIAAKIRVADHRSNWTERNTGRSKQFMLDVGPHALSVSEAMAQIEARFKAASAARESSDATQQVHGIPAARHDGETT